MENLLLNLNLIDKDSIIIEHKGTRDDPNINIKMCTKSKIRWLDLQQSKNYSEESLEEYYVGTDIKNLSLDEIRKETYKDDKRRTKYIENILNGDNTRNILDFGCGTGGFLNLLKNKYNSYGVEMSDIYRNLLNNDELEVYKSIDELNIIFDIICLWHVFEHLDDPIGLLTQIKNYLKPDGIILIEVPHAQDILMTRYNNLEFKKFNYWSEHLILHTKESLQKFIEKSDLKLDYIKGIQRYNLANHLYWMSNNKPGGHRKWRDLSTPVLDNEYENILNNINSTDTLLAYCKL